MSMTGGDEMGNSIGDDDLSHVMRDSYKETSGNQYSAHQGCQDMLLGCAKRLKERGHQNNNPSSATTQWKIADLGSADGSNSIRTIEIFLDALNRDGEPNNAKESTTGDSNLHIVFEEHPSSDEAKLTETVASWFETKTRQSESESKSENKITYDVLMKSFYEPLFEANSIDLCMSYICLHWLDSTDTRGSEEIRGWKWLHLDDSSRESETTGSGGFLQVNERAAPQELKVLWKEKLADRHLARFLALRARELKPGAELLVVMVSDPHEYWRPERSRESPLLKAMKRCIAEGSLRQQVLERTIVPYYLRQPQDILDALELAQQQAAQKQEAPIHSLEIMEIRQYETLTGGNNENENGEGDGMKGARDLFWAIHGGAVVTTGGANDDEVVAIQNRLIETFDESYDPRTGIVKGNFIACVFRKKNE
jgi:hypothetical protein